MSVSAPSAARLVTGVSVEPARDDAGEMLELRIDVEADAVQAHPAPHAHADARDLGAADEDADLRRRAARLRRRGGPASRSAKSSSAATKARTSRPRRAEVEHHIGHALAGAVIGEAPAAAAPIHRKARRHRAARRAWRWCRPYRGEGAPAATRIRCASPRAIAADAGIHGRERVGIGHGRVALPAIRPRAVGAGARSRAGLRRMFGHKARHLACRASRLQAHPCTLRQVC